MPTDFVLKAPKSLLKTSVMANACQTIIALIPPEVKVVSFDCFDTLLWRNVAEPKDVFYTLCEHPFVKSLGLTVALRTMSEQVAYQLNKIRKNQTQATLQDIYQQAFPEATPDVIQQLIEIECQCEKEACFAYPPMMELVKALHGKGYKLIITSDTYFTKPLLKALLLACMPEAVVDCFDEIYTSCDQGTAKFESLFKHILEKRVLSPNVVCHIGDHPISDYDKPSKAGMHAIQLIQYSPHLTEIHRMMSLAAPMTDDSIRKSRPLTLPLKGLTAAYMTRENPADVIGYAVIGPLLLAFSEFIIRSVTQQAKTGKRLKVGYLLRDAYLPARVTDALHEKPLGKDIRISRFTAYAASFRTVDDVDRYLATRLASGRFKEMAKQLGLPPKLIETLVTKAQKANQPTVQFNKSIHQPEILNQIFVNSKAYCERLFRYLEKTLGLARGDTLLFVDLGYTGTAQLRLAPVFKREYDIEIEGCYLLSLKTPISQIKKVGLIGPDHYDDKTLMMLVTYIALLEQVCTSTGETVTNFQDNGDPITEACSLSNDQIDKIKPIHEACLQFIEDYRQQGSQFQLSLSDRDLRDMAAFHLARLLYLPTKLENDYFSQFQHDVNLGTDDMIPLVDTEKSLHDLKRRGWLHSLKVKTEESRMNYAAEWRALSLELSLLLMTQHRFDFKVAPNDISQRILNVPVVIRLNNENNLLNFEATLTYDGYYSLIIPTPRQSEIGVCFGKSYPTVHLYAFDRIELHHLYADDESSKATCVLDKVLLHEMQLSRDGVVTSESDNALMLYRANQENSLTAVIRIIFKPLTSK